MEMQTPEMSPASEGEDSEKPSLVDLMKEGNVAKMINSNLTLREQWKLAKAIDPVGAKRGTGKANKWQALFETRIARFNIYQTAVRGVRAAAIEANLRISRLDYNGAAKVEANAGTLEGLYARLKTAHGLAVRNSKTYPNALPRLHAREREVFKKDLTRGEIFPEDVQYFPEAEVIREDYTKGMALGSVKDQETGRIIRLRGLPKSLGVIDGRKQLAVLVRWVQASMAPQISLWEPARGKGWAECPDYTRSWNLVFLDLDHLDKSQLTRVLQACSSKMRPNKKGYREPISLYWTKEERGPTPLDVTMGVGFGPRRTPATQEDGPVSAQQSSGGMCNEPGLCRPSDDGHGKTT